MKTDEKSFSEFLRDTVKAKEPKKIGKKKGSMDLYRHYVNTDKTKDGSFNIPYKLWSAILKDWSEFFFEELFNTGEFNLPFACGSFYVIKRSYKPKMINGELIYNAPVDWGRTMKLWYRDPEAKKNKVLVKIEPCTKYLIRFKMARKRQSSPNKFYYSGVVSRSFKKKINQMAEEGREPAFIREL